jgi:hypothetical protein
MFVAIVRISKLRPASSSLMPLLRELVAPSAWYGMNWMAKLLANSELAFPQPGSERQPLKQANSILR